MALTRCNLKTTKKIERMQDILENSSEWILYNCFIANQASVTITVPDLSQYHWLLIYTDDYRTGDLSGQNNHHPRVFLMSYEEFKNNYTANNKTVVTQLNTGSTNWIGVYYVSDTKIGVFGNFGSKERIYIKGIKNGTGSLQDIVDNAETILNTTQAQSTTSNKTVSDLSEYHWLILYNRDFKTQGSDGSQRASILIISYDDFKTYNTARYTLAMTWVYSSNAYSQAGIYYVNDTTVTLYTGSTGTIPFVIKGIKGNKLL